LKSDTVFKRAFNELLELLSRLPLGARIDPETRLADSVGVSRTTIRKALRELIERRILKRKDAKLVLARKPDERDYFPMADTIAASDRVESKLMEWFSREGRHPGEYVNGLVLAREFSVSTSAVRDCLRRFEQFGLVEKRPNSGWIFRGFTTEFALEPFECASC
jgi:DNA-binding GntR family transcriptional regulator